MARKGPLRLLGILLLTAGVAAATSGVWLFLVLHGRAAQRVASGVAVNARVTEVRHRGFGVFGGQEYVVGYEYGGRQYEARLMSLWSEKRRDSPASVTLFIEADDPANASTADDFISEDLLATVPSTAIAAALVLSVLGAQAFYSGRSRRLTSIPGVIGGDETSMVSSIELQNALRGYSKPQVNLLLAELAWVLDRGTEQDRAVTRRRLRDARFEVVWGGYYRKEVDRFVTAMSNLLD